MSLKIEVKQIQKFRENLDYYYSESRKKIETFLLENVFASSKFAIDAWMEGIKSMSIEKKQFQFREGS